MESQVNCIIILTMPFKFFTQVEENILLKIHATNFPELKSVQESPALHLSHTIKIFAQSLMGLYIPIFIFNLPYAPNLSINPVVNSIILVLIFYLVRSLVSIISLHHIVNLIFSKLNFKTSIFWGNILLAIALFSLSIAENNVFFFYLSATIFAIDAILYWVPYHILFIRKSNNNGKFGKSFGKRLLYINLSSALGPLIGGIIITFMGFSYLFWIGIILIVLSSLPVLYWVNDTKHGQHNAINIIGSIIRKRKFRNDSIAISSIETEALLHSIFWPILLFLLAESYSIVGIIISISVLIASLSAIIIGNLVDKQGAKLIHKIGVTIRTILYIPKAFIINLPVLYSIDILDRINSNLYNVPFYAVMYQHAKQKTHDTNFIIYRSYIVNFVSSIVCFGIIFLLLFLPDWRMVFIIVAMITPLAYLINKSSD